MRVNIYREEITDQVFVVTKTVDGIEYTGLRFFLQLPATVDGKQYQGPFIHRPGDDDSSAVTFWDVSRHGLKKLMTAALVQLETATTATSREAVQKQYPNAHADYVPPTHQQGQSAPYQAECWEVWPEQQKALGDEPLGVGKTEIEAWNNAKDRL